VPGGPYLRGDDALHSNTTYPANVSGFRLDAFDVTVGRFRSFVSAWDAGWRPAAGSGKHTHLNSGAGLVAQGMPGTYEAGWSAGDNANLATTLSGWTANLTPPTVNSPTWTASPTSNDNLPIAGVTWYETYAFCIWDGGFLPSDLEWLFAASGGGDGSSGQRVYPWSVPPDNSSQADCTHANFNNNLDPACPNPPTILAVGLHPSGNGRWGQSDLGGNVWQRVLDYATGYGVPCTDCSNLLCPQGGCVGRLVRGGALFSTARDLQPGAPGNELLGVTPDQRSYSQFGANAAELGIRCARVP
jgi:formylglycine-generating enzyme required for sulfatase activity